MVRTVLKWAWRLLALALVTGVVVRVLKSTAPSDRTGGEQLPTIRGDTWPPVPLNPRGNR
jgi:hypothetical protein